MSAFKVLTVFVAVLVIYAHAQSSSTTMKPARFRRANPTTPNSSSAEQKPKRQAVPSTSTMVPKVKRAADMLGTTVTGPIKRDIPTTATPIVHKREVMMSTTTFLPKKRDVDEETENGKRSAESMKQDSVSSPTPPRVKRGAFTSTLTPMARMRRGFSDATTPTVPRQKRQIISSTTPKL